ncbi:MAG: glycosyl hydrolase [Gemmatimonadota bacterium]
MFATRTRIVRHAPLLLVATLVVSWPAPAASQTVDTSFFNTLTWRNIGPDRGGRSQAIAGSPSRPDEYYFGAVGGGVWKTTDGGETWRPVTDGQLNSSSVGAVAVSRSNPDVVYVGMGETELRGNIMQGDGVYKSTDGGKTWKHVGLTNTQAIARIRVSPTDPDLVYVAALGHPFGANPERGVFRSRDGGATWQKVLFVSDSAGAVDLVMDHTNPDVLYASTWQVYRTPWKMWGGGPGSKLFKTTDGGDHWTELTKNPGMPAPPIGKIGITVSPADPHRLYAIVEANEGGVFRSDDGGATWKRTNDERKIRQRSFYYSRIYADPKDPDVVYALNTSLYRSKDGGKTFDAIRTPHGDHHDLWIAPDDPDRMADASDGGGVVSINGGKSWTEQDYPTAQLYHIMTTSDFPYHVCGAQQDNSTVCVPSDDWDNMQARGPNHGWYYAVGGGESGYIAESPTDPNVFYAGSQGALLTRYDRSNGQIRDIQPDPRFFSGEPASALPERWQWTFPIVFSPVDSTHLYTTSQHVWLTTDDGQTWKKISPDLTLADPKTLGKSGGLITMDMNGPEIYGTVFALAPSHFDVNTLWAGSDDGLIHVTRDGGANWQDVTPPDMAKYTRVSIIEASSHDAATAYVAGKRYQLDDRSPYIWRTHDYGRTWTKIVNGIPGNDFVHAVREDPVRAHLLYAGTEHGVYVSFDDGDHWQSLQLNLPDTKVADLVVEKHDLVAGTHGRSIWVLDDIDPLRQITPRVAASAAHLFTPRPAYRGVENGVIQYWLAHDADSVTVSILDGNGAVVRRFVGTPADTTQSGEAQGYGRRAPRPPTVHTGLNRFEWDLRYPGATTFEGMITWSARPQSGPKAPPGRYTVRMTANGVTETQPLEVRMDPRLKGVTAEDLREQFALASEIRDATSAANQAVIDIRALRKAVEAGMDTVKQHGASGARLRRLEHAVQPLLDGTREIEQALYQTKNRSGQDPLNFPIKLNNRLAALRRSVETGDAKPTAGAYRVFRQLKEQLDQQLNELDHVVDARLPGVNSALKAVGAQPVGWRTGK